MKKRIVFGALAFFVAVAFAPRPQAQTAASQQTVTKAPVQHTSAGSGKEMYDSYCAACHGKDGKGDGPAAAALKVPPADLSQLAKNNGGKFPADHVASVLRFGVEAPAHGSKDMPTWGTLFSSVDNVSASDAMVQLRIHNLTKYIESLQAK
jgi:mono/diheme cytochrome c family protein